MSIGPKDFSQYSALEIQQMMAGCPYCRSLPVTNNPDMCLCARDCGREDGCGCEPARETNDSDQFTSSYLTGEDRDPSVQAYRKRLREQIAADKAEALRKKVA